MLINRREVLNEFFCRSNVNGTRKAKRDEQNGTEAWLIAAHRKEGVGMV